MNVNYPRRCPSRCFPAEAAGGSRAGCGCEGGHCGTPEEAAEGREAAAAASAVAEGKRGLRTDIMFETGCADHGEAANPGYRLAQSTQALPYCHFNEF